MQDSENLQTEQSESFEPPRPPTPEELGAVLRGEDPASIAEAEADDERESAGEGSDRGEAEPAAGEAGESPETAKPTTFDELAERAGLDVKDLHGVKVNLGGDDGDNVVTIGELKDRYNAADNFAAKELQLETERQNLTAEMTKARADLVSLVKLLPEGAITPKFVERVQRERAAELREQQQLTLNTIREWRDETTQTADREAMREHLSRYGLPGEYLDNVIDHRMLAILRDATLLRRSVDNAVKQTKRVRRPGHGQSKNAPVRKKATTRRTAGRTLRDSELAAEAAALIAKG